MCQDMKTEREHREPWLLLREMGGGSCTWAAWSNLYCKPITYGAEEREASRRTPRFLAWATGKTKLLSAVAGMAVDRTALRRSRVQFWSHTVWDAYYTFKWRCQLGSWTYKLVVGKTSRLEIQLWESSEHKYTFKAVM